MLHLSIPMDNRSSLSLSPWKPTSISLSLLEIFGIIITPLPHASSSCSMPIPCVLPFPLGMHCDSLCPLHSLEVPSNPRSAPCFLHSTEDTPRKATSSHSFLSTLSRVLSITTEDFPKKISQEHSRFPLNFTGLFHSNRRHPKALPSSRELLSIPRVSKDKFNKEVLQVLP